MWHKMMRLVSKLVTQDITHLTLHLNSYLAPLTHIVAYSFCLQMEQSIAVNGMTVVLTKNKQKKKWIEFRDFFDLNIFI